MISAIPLLILLISFLVLLLLSKNKYKDEVAGLDKNEYSTKDLFGVGFFIIDKTGISSFKKIGKKSLEKLMRIYGSEADHYFRIFIANKIVTAFIMPIAVYFIVALSKNLSICSIIYGIAFAVLGFFTPDYELKKKIDRRSKEILFEFPDFLNKLILLVNAGLTVDKAWDKIVKDGGKETPMFYELRKVNREVASGKSRDQAYHDMARRCKVPEISKFINILIQNSKKGTSDLVIVLQAQSQECWGIRKSISKQKGEEATTKLLFPMMIMLLAIFLIVIVPAIFQITGV